MPTADQPKRSENAHGTAAAGGAAPASPPLNAWVLLAAVGRHWLAAAVLGVLAAGAVGASVWYFLPPAPYTATALFRIESTPQGTLYDHPEAHTKFSNYEELQVALLKSHMVLNDALNRPGVAQIPDVRKATDQVAWLEKQIHIDFSNGPEILRLTISTDNAKDCKTLVDAVTAVYLKEVGEDANKRRTARQSELSGLVDAFGKKLKTLRADMRKQAEAVGTDDNQVLAVKQRIPYERALEIQRQLIEVETRLRTLKNEQSLAKTADPSSVEISDRAVDALVDKSPEIAALLKEKARQEAVIEVTAKDAAGGENHPAVVALKAQLDTLKSELEAKRKALREDAKAQLRQGGAAAAAARATQLRDAIASDETLQKRLASDLEQLENESKTLNKVALDLEDKKLEIAHAEADEARATQALDKLSVEKDDPQRVTLWEKEGTVVTHPDETERKIRFSGMSAAGAFLAAVLLVALVEFRSRRVHSPHQVAHGLGMTLVGTVPARPGGRLAAAPLWTSLLTESIDAARTMILHGESASAVRLVMVTSAVGGEAKTSLAGHLAVSLARSGRKTLLIDGDLRNPAVHSLFELPLGPGFSELLRGEAAATEVVRPTRVPGLEVLTAGAYDQAALALLSQGGVPNLFAALKESFDIVVLDSSPVLPVADALQLARHVDGVLISVLQNVSTVPDVHEARRRLAALGVVILGVVVSGTRPDVAGYGRRRYVASTPTAS